MLAVVLAAKEARVRPRQEPAGRVGVGRQRPERPLQALDLAVLPCLPGVRTAPQPLTDRPDVDGIVAPHRRLLPPFWTCGPPPQRPAATASPAAGSEYTPAKYTPANRATTRA